MFHDPNMPDFDSMSQEELIEWLETLAQRQSDEEAEMTGDYATGTDELDSRVLPDLLDPEEWSAWIEEDEDLQQETPPVIAAKLEVVQDLDEDDDETPTALTIIDEGVGDDTTDPLTGLEEIVAIEQPSELLKVPVPEDELDSLENLLGEEDLPDPLDWLESLASEVSDAATTSATADDDASLVVDDIDEDYEDSEALDDAEDESLYSRRLDESMAFLESLVGLEDYNPDEFSTQSMAPWPDILISQHEAENEAIAAEAGLGNVGAPAAHDSLIDAFLVQDHQADLEAWYAARLQAVATGADTATKAHDPPPPAAEQREASLNLAGLPPPPPGLAAGFNSARRKIANQQLYEALSDYETLLRANIGLELVIGDMHWLIAQEQFRENAAVHRVLGDALMRQGHLQEALDVYRHALKLL